jgi:serine protease Do
MEPQPGWTLTFRLQNEEGVWVLNHPPRLKLFALITSIVVMLSYSSSAFAQQVTSAEAKPPVTVNKLDTTSLQYGGSFLGNTAVELEADLEKIASGDEPKTLSELLALERQQVKIAKQIIAVTVNISQGSAQGSGVIVSPDGYVLTAAHVAGRPGREAKITLSDGRIVMGKTLGMDRSVDAGLIKITEGNSNWPHASLNVTKKLIPGQWVIASGHPGGYDENRPAVIRVGRLIEMIPYKEPTTLVTDCALIGGDSGGPLFDLTGRLIGIHSRIGSEVADNMHVPIRMFNEGWERMVKGESWGTLPGHKPVIGVRGRSGTNASTNAYIESVLEDGPADQAGIQSGDIVTRFDGVDVKTFDDLIKAVETTIPGDRVKVTVRRQNKLIDLRLIIGLQSDEE